MDTSILAIFHGGTKKEILNIEGAVPCSFVGIGDGTVDMYLSGEERDSWGARVTREIKLVASEG